MKKKELFTFLGSTGLKLMANTYIYFLIKLLLVNAAFVSKENSL